MVGGGVGTTRRQRIGSGAKDAPSPRLKASETLGGIGFPPPPFGHPYTLTPLSGVSTPAVISQRHRGRGATERSARQPLENDRGGCWIAADCVPGRPSSRATATARGELAPDKQSKVLT